MHRRRPLAGPPAIPRRPLTAARPPPGGPRRRRSVRLVRQGAPPGGGRRARHLARLDRSEHVGGAAPRRQERGHERVAAADRGPADRDRQDGDEPVLAARSPVEHLDAARAQRHDHEPAQVVGHVPEPRHDRVVERAGPAHEPDVDGPHRPREPLHGVVAEAEEVGGDLGAFDEPGSVQPVQLADRALHEHQVDAPGAGDQGLLLGRRPVRRPDPLHEVVHVGLQVRLDGDVDGCRRATTHDRTRRVRDPVAGQEVQEDLGPVVADARQEVPRIRLVAEVPGHVEDAAAGQHEVPSEVDVEARGAQEQGRRGRCRTAGHAGRLTARPGDPASRRRARGTGRSGPRPPCWSARTPRPRDDRIPLRGTTPSDRGSS